MPRSRASCGEANSTLSPSKTISPESGGNTPVMTLIRVDLPAPLSPIRATTSPRRTSKSTPLRACTAPKDLSIPLTRSSGPLRSGPPPDPFSCTVVPPSYERGTMPRLHIGFRLVLDNHVTQHQVSQYLALWSRGAIGLICQTN